jgi:hypothetical protein
MANYQKIKGTQDFFGLEALKKRHWRLESEL